MNQYHYLTFNPEQQVWSTEKSKAWNYGSVRLECTNVIWWGWWVQFYFSLRAAAGSGLFCFPAGMRVLPLDNAQKFVVRGGVLRAEVLCCVLADAQLDCLCWRNFPQLYLFVLSRMCVSFAALILCGWSRFLCFFRVWGYFLSVSCQNFNICFSSVKFFLLVAGSWSI